jgi:hypothetical protein
MGMIYWIHRDTANRWSNSPPTFSSSLTQLTQGILFITDLSNYSPALEVNAANFA